MDAALELGSRGQFEVTVDGKTVASRSATMFHRVFRGIGWPSEDRVVAALARRLGK